MGLSPLSNWTLDNKPNRRTSTSQSEYDFDKRSSVEPYRLDIAAPRSPPQQRYAAAYRDESGLEVDRCCVLHKSVDERPVIDLAAVMNCVIPEDVLHSARLSPGELKQEIAVLLFQKDRLTLGQASELADMPVADFQHLLASRGISPHYNVEDLEDDVETLRKLGRL